MTDPRQPSLQTRLLQILIVCCSVLIISCVVSLLTVFVLIPSYIDDVNGETQSNSHRYTNTWALRFKSNLRFNDSQTLMPSDLKELSASLDQIFDFESGSTMVIQAAFAPKSNDEMQDNSNTQLMKDSNDHSETVWFNVELQMRYPSQCGDHVSCHAVFRNQVSTKFTQQDAFYVSIQLNNDRVIRVGLHFHQLIEDYDPTNKQNVVNKDQTDFDDNRIIRTQVADCIPSANDHCQNRTTSNSNEQSSFLYEVTVNQSGEIFVEDSQSASEQPKTEDVVIVGRQGNNQSYVMLLDR